MDNQDKETIGLMIKDYIHPLDKKVGRVLDKLEEITEAHKKHEKTQKLILDETSGWRWLQRKPKRFGIVILIGWVLSLDGVQNVIVDKVKYLNSVLGFF